MDDMERYGDYNEIDEPPRGKSAASRIIKIAIALLCIFVVGFMAFRIFLFNYYPPEMKNIYFNDTLTAFYNEKGGDIGAKTQEIRFPYDHQDKGRFFSDHLIVIREAGQLQITLRYNRSLIDTLEEEYGVELTGDDIFTFVLARDGRDNANESIKSETVGTLTVNESDSLMLYNYHKLVFDGIDFGSETEPEVEWLRVEVYVKGIELKDPINLLIYENNDAYSLFKDYDLSDKERP
jgi:hypothetical protein